MPPRGRPRKHPSSLPPSVCESHGAYYHIVKGVWHPLGRNLPAALELYGRRVSPALKEGELNPLIDAAFDVMKARKANPLSSNTVKHYESASKKLKHLLRQFSRPEQIKQKDAAMIKLLLAPSPGMANRVLSFGSLVFAQFVEQQIIDNNPFTGIKRHQAGRRTRLIKQDEWDRIYKVAGPRLQSVMDMLYLTDQRIDDVLSMDERNFWDEGIYFKQKKTRKEIIVKWNTQLRECIERARALHGKVVKVNFTDATRPRWLFKARHGGRPGYRTIYNQWIKATALAGVEDCNLHDNRAFSATDAEAQGLDPQKLLGHESPRTTKIYLRGRVIEVVEGPQMKRTA